MLEADAPLGIELMTVSYVDQSADGAGTRRSREFIFRTFPRSSCIFSSKVPLVVVSFPETTLPPIQPRSLSGSHIRASGGYFSSICLRTSRVPRRGDEREVDVD